MDNIILKKSSFKNYSANQKKQPNKHVSFNSLHKQFEMNIDNPKTITECEMSLDDSNRIFTHETNDSFQSDKESWIDTNISSNINSFDIIERHLFKIKILYEIINTLLLIGGLFLITHLVYLIISFENVYKDVYIIFGCVLVSSLLYQIWFNLRIVYQSQKDYDITREELSSQFLKISLMMLLFLVFTAIEYYLSFSTFALSKEMLYYLERQSLTNYIYPILIINEFVVLIISIVFQQYYTPLDNITNEDLIETLIEP